MIMIMVVAITVPKASMVPSDLITASTHISMILITIVLLLVMLMALFGITAKGDIIPSSSQR